MKTQLFVLCVVVVSILITCLSPSGHASRIEGEAAGRSFAVFMVTYDKTGARVQGGVAGTAFFVSGKRAMTAYHVLQPKSFEVREGFTRTRIWLVHENHAAIEIAASNVKYDKDNDLTSIDLSVGVTIEPEFIFEKQGIAASRPLPQSGSVAVTRVETEGFIANTAGPHLSWLNGNVEILSVPHLARIRLSGEMLQRARVDLKAVDVNLKATPCIQVTYQPVRGISGGPLLVDGRVVGMNSFADPGTGKQTWAVVL